MACAARYKIMERPDFKKQIKLRLVLYPAIAVLIYGILAYFYNPYTKVITKREDKAVNILLLTAPPMFISYNPYHKKALVTNIELTKKGLKTQDILKNAGLSEKEVLFISPTQKNRADFWEAFKINLRSWNYKPYIVLTYLFEYPRLRLTGKTNIPLSDFVMMSMDLMQLSPADFSVKNPQKETAPRARRRNAPPPPPQQIMLAQNIKPGVNAKKAIVIEILNASGQQGLASDVTRYLRELSNSGVLNVDVINYATYPTVEEKTQILDINGRLEDLKKIGYYLDLEDNEIFTTIDKTAISDAKIILGADFVMPKSPK